MFIHPLGKSEREFMMKLSTRLFLLVLTVSSTTGGEEDVTKEHRPMNTSEGYNPAKALMSANPTSLPRTTAVPSSSSSFEKHASANSTDLPSAASMAPEAKPTSANHTSEGEREGRSGPLATTTEVANGSMASSATAMGFVTTPVSTATNSTASKKETKAEKQSSSWGYVILVVIILVIITLCVILYYLRRASRTYSFDLHRPCPANHLSATEQTGTFENVYLDDLRVSKDNVTSDDISQPPVANGTSLQPGDKGSAGESAAQERGPETPPTSDGDLSLGVEQLGSTDAFFDMMGEEEQNNNPPVCSTQPFVEINLDELALCDHLLTSPEAPSSVLPFSPFSFSSSSFSSP